MSIKLDAEDRDAFEKTLAHALAERAFAWEPKYYFEELISYGTPGTINNTDYELVSGTLAECGGCGDLDPGVVADRALLDDEDIAVLSRDKDIRLHWDHWIGDMERYGVNLQAFNDEDDLWEAMLRHCTGIQYFETE
tara:strand:- start:195 stop:605 length:411 start_codon:yes stop_codon:yes gene_type:complete